MLLIKIVIGAIASLVALLAGSASMAAWPDMTTTVFSAGFLVAGLVVNANTSDIGE